MHLLKGAIFRGYDHRFIISFIISGHRNRNPENLGNLGYEMMKNRIFTVLTGSVVFAIMLGIVYIAYEANRIDMIRIKNAQVLRDITPMRDQVNETILDNASIKKQKYENVEAKKISPNLNFLEITEDGYLLIKTMSTLIVLYPVYEDEKIVWRCLGGDDRYVSIECRSKQ